MYPPSSQGSNTSVISILLIKSCFCKDNDLLINIVGFNLTFCIRDLAKRIGIPKHPPGGLAHPAIQKVAYIFVTL